jgi:hypothetical protein
MKNEKEIGNLSSPITKILALEEMETNIHGIQRNRIQW